MSPFAMGVSIFVITYLAIISERMDKTIAVLVGAAMMLLLHILNQEKAFHAIDLNVIFLLISMMIIVHIMSTTGVFQYVAIKLAKVAKGDPLKLLILLCVATAGISAFLDNVTTVILIAPVTFLLADELQIDPKPFIIMLAISSNIGGTATLVGDPPNILIGSAANLSFNAFLFHMAPVVVIIMTVAVVMMRIMFRNAFHVTNEQKARIVDLNESKAIRNYPLLWKSLGVLVLVIGLFLVHEYYQYEAATVALAGAAVLLFISKATSDEVLKYVEWPTIFFFVGLFIIVEGLVEVGFIDWIAREALKLTRGDLTITTIFLLWFSAIFSAIVDNIPYAATMIPMVKQVGATIMESTHSSHNAVFYPLWWSLALGACLGGNATIIGASANVVLVGLSKKNGHHITFFQFFKYGILFTFMSMVICSGYLYVRYLWN